MNTKALRQKIVDLAIHGKLLSAETVAELKKSPDYEPADILLEKIRKEKEEKIAKGELKADKKDSFIFTSDRELSNGKLGEQSKGLRHKRRYEQFADGTIKDIEDEVPFDVPEGWAWKHGKEIFLPMFTKTPAKTGTFKYIDIDAIDNKQHKITVPKIIEGIKAPSRASRGVYTGDVIFSLVRPYLENIALIKEKHSDCIASTGFYVCKPNKAVYPEYLFYLMTSNYVIKGLNEFMKGDNSPSISGYDIVNWLYPIPPLAEQKLIVTEIERIFAQIDLLEQNKTDLQAAVKQAKSKILDLAIHGKLVPQDVNDEPASVLLEKLRAEKEEQIAKGNLKHDKNDSYIYRGSDNRHYEKLNRKEICIDDEIPFEIPESWQWERLGNICDKLVDGDHNPPKGIGHKTEYLMLSSRNINHNQIVDLENVRYLTKEVFEIENKRTNAKAGDILFTSVGSLGRSCIFNGNKNICFQRSVSVLHTQVYNSWLKYFFDSNYYQNYINENATGTAQMGFYLQQMSASLIAIPSIEEQKRIVSTIDKFYADLDQIQNNII